MVCLLKRIGTYKALDLVASVRVSESQRECCILFLESP